LPGFAQNFIEKLTDEATIVMILPTTNCLQQPEQQAIPIQKGKQFESMKSLQASEKTSFFRGRSFVQKLEQI
jgi:hypothetical protein